MSTELRRSLISGLVRDCEIAFNSLRQLLVCPLLTIRRFDFAIGDWTSWPGWPFFFGGGDSRAF